MRDATKQPPALAHLWRDCAGWHIYASTPANLKAEAQRIRDLRNARAANRRADPPTDPTRQPAPRFGERMVEKIKKEVERQIYQSYRQPQSRWAGGEVSVKVAFSETPVARAEQEKAWSRNGKWRGMNVTFHVSISPTRHHMPADVQLCGGMVTTHAAEIEPGLYEATWIVQGRGTNIAPQSGFIMRWAHDDRVDYLHGETLAQISRQMKRIAKNAAEAEVVGSLAATIKNIPASVLVEMFGSLEITQADSRRGGNCKTGTESFCACFFDGRTRGKLGELAPFAADPAVQLAIRACVLRHARKTQSVARRVASLPAANLTA